MQTNFSTLNNFSVCGLSKPTCIMFTYDANNLSLGKRGVSILISKNVGHLYKIQNSWIV